MTPLNKSVTLIYIHVEYVMRNVYDVTRLLTNATISMQDVYYEMIYEPGKDDTDPMDYLS